MQIFFLSLITLRLIEENKTGCKMMWKEEMNIRVFNINWNCFLLKVEKNVVEFISFEHLF